MTPTAGPGARRRGRPTVLDPARVAIAAIRLWEERGYDNTSWDDIAAAAGVSVRTLMRHFPSKASLAWVGVPAATLRLIEAIRAIPLETPLADAARTAVVASVSDHAVIRANGGSWRRVVAREPELSAASVRAFAPWTDALAQEISRRRPGAPRAVCRAVATAYREAAHAALLEWAETAAHDSPARAVDATLRWLDLDISIPEVIM